MSGGREALEARAAAAKTREYPAAERMWPSSVTTGVLPMSLTGRFANERQRLGPEFTDAERRWRIKWFRDQQLHHSEPVDVPRLQQKLLNPLRRWYRKPLDLMEQRLLQPRIVSRTSPSLLPASLADPRDCAGARVVVAGASSRGERSSGVRDDTRALVHHQVQPAHVGAHVGRRCALLALSCPAWQPCLPAPRPQTQPRGLQRLWLQATNRLATTRPLTPRACDASPA